MLNIREIAGKVFGQEREGTGTSIVITYTEADIEKKIKKGIEKIYLVPPFVPINADHVLGKASLPEEECHFPKDFFNLVLTSDIQEVYVGASKTRRKIQFGDVTVGGKTPQDKTLLNASFLAKNRVSPFDLHLLSVLEDSDFKALPDGQVHRLAGLKVRELIGDGVKPDINNLFECALSSGLKACPGETGLRFVCESWKKLDMKHKAFVAFAFKEGLYFFELRHDNHGELKIIIDSSPQLNTNDTVFFSLGVVQS
jgi:hypothetical protein